LSMPRTVKPNKAQLVLDFPRDNSGTNEIAARLKENGVTIRDVTVNLPRFEKKCRVYFRGYRNADHETPFAAAYTVTCVDTNKPREIAIAEARPYRYYGGSIRRGISCEKPLNIRPEQGS